MRADEVCAFKWQWNHFLNNWTLSILLFIQFSDWQMICIFVFNDHCEKCANWLINSKHVFEKSDMAKYIYSEWKFIRTEQREEYETTTTIHDSTLNQNWLSDWTCAAKLLKQNTESENLIFLYLSLINAKNGYSRCICARCCFCIILMT